ncbi:hypothetical protein HO173_008454 [Letharia columbiana]|uniref:Uncharacterized protein n=1 Tax=Letharia columbiana TaxID=112416 RepID=A0A8H6FRD0_9LECA|nr:uncharacterized protein HO173_008454 [Letharia columbiana]KAF6233330.1 hypothetical protein HO173_008454 [Letharia columbiana]
MDLYRSISYEERHGEFDDELDADTLLTDLLVVGEVVDEIADDEKEEMLVPALEADVLGMVTAKGEELLRRVCMVIDGRRRFFKNGTLDLHGDLVQTRE